MDILLIEDDTKTALYVTESLGKHGHIVRWAATGTDGLLQAQLHKFDLLIVDRMLPKLDGLSLVKALRGDRLSTPVLFLTTMSGLDDRVEGLNVGADDYLTKPFAFSELLARVVAITRRAQRDSEVQTSLRAGRLEMNLLSRSVTREGRDIELQQQEFELLRYLLQNAGKTVTRGMLLENVWKLNFAPGTNVVESHMSRLRSKVDRGFNGEMIRTIRGAGYVLRAD